MLHLFETLKNDESIKTVYFTEDGKGWLLSPNYRHPLEKSREDVLAMEESVLVEESDSVEDEEKDEDVTEEFNRLKEENSKLTSDVESLKVVVNGLKDQLTKEKAKNKKIKEAANTDEQNS